MQTHGNIFFLKCLIKFISNPSWVWCFLLHKVINYWLDSLIGTGLFRLLISSVWASADHVFSGIRPFHLSYQFVGIQQFILFIYDSFNVHGLCNDIPLSFLTQFLSLLFYLAWIRKLTHFVGLFKTFGFVAFLYWFPI